MTGPAMTTLASGWADRAEAMETAAELVPIIEDIRQMRDRAKDMGLYQAYSVIEGHLHRARISLIRLYEEV